MATPLPNTTVDVTYTLLSMLYTKYEHNINYNDNQLAEVTITIKAEHDYSSCKTFVQPSYMILL